MMDGKTQFRIKRLKNKIEALTMAALEPEILCNGVHGHLIMGVSQIEQCREEAIDLLDEIARKAALE